MSAIEKLAASVPPAVHEVCNVLHNAGHRGLAVGGAVRDAMLGRVPGDWDVTTDANPETVQSLFRRTIPTGSSTARSRSWLAKDPRSSASK